MFHDPLTPEKSARLLRLEAENRLRAGSAPGSSLPLDREALTLLYEMASDPRRSAEALRLLQELQVHQVELELQRAQLETNEREMSRELTLYRELFNRAPGACLVVTPEGRIIEANPAAAALFHAEAATLTGRDVLELLALPGRATWRDLLAAFKAGEQAVHCDLAGAGVGDTPDILQVVATPSPAGDALLLFATRSDPDSHAASRPRPSA